jgi:hypothetical protein
VKKRKELSEQTKAMGLELYDQKREKYDKAHVDAALWCLKPENPIRRFAFAVMEFKIRGVAVLDTIIWVAITISSVLMAFDSPLTDENSKLNRVLNWINFGMTVLFTIEVVVKVICLGFVMNGPKSYLRNSSNGLDFFVVVASWIGIFVTNQNLRFVKILRMARLTRPMRLIFRNENLKISIKVLGVAIPQLLRLLLLSLLIFIIFAIVGVKLFLGKSFYCQTSQVIGINQEHTDILIRNGFDCLNYGGEWRE